MLKVKIHQKMLILWIKMLIEIFFLVLDFWHLTNDFQNLKSPPMPDSARWFESRVLEWLEENQHKNNCLVSIFYNKLKSPALFSHLFRTEKSAGNFNLLWKLLTRQLFLFWFASRLTTFSAVILDHFLGNGGWIFARLFVLIMLSIKHMLPIYIKLPLPIWRQSDRRYYKKVNFRSFHD